VREKQGKRALRGVRRGRGEHQAASMPPPLPAGTAPADDRLASPPPLPPQRPDGRSRAPAAASAAPEPARSRRPDQRAPSPETSFETELEQLALDLDADDDTEEPAPPTTFLLHADEGSPHLSRPQPTSVRASGAALLEKQLYAELASRAATMGLSAPEFARREFQNCDVDGSGELDLSELKMVLHAVDITIADPDVATLLAHLDTDGDGCLSIDEFVRALLEDRLKYLRSKLRAASYTLRGVDLPKLFKHYDRDNSGELQFKEFKSAVRRDAKLSTSEVSDAELLELFRTVDSDHNGSIELQEFVVMLTDPSTSEVVAEARTTTQVGQVLARVLESAEAEQRGSQAQLMHVFGTHATSGRLDRNGLRKLIKAFDVTVTKEELDELMAELSVTTGNGFISPTAFSDRMRLAKKHRHTVSSANSPRRKAKLQRHTSENLEFMKKKLKMISGEQDPRKLFSRYDRDHSGALDFQEFKTAVRKGGRIPPATLSDDALRHLFSAADEDGSGDMSIEELAVFIWGEGMRMSTPSPPAHSFSDREQELQPEPEPEPEPELARGARKTRSPRPSARAGPAKAEPEVAKLVFGRIIEHAESRHINLMYLFHRFDPANSGSLDRKQFNKAMLDLGLKLSASDLDGVIAEMDADGDGFVTAKEFSDRVKLAKKQKRQEAAGSSSAVRKKVRPATVRSAEQAAQDSQQDEADELLRGLQRVDALERSISEQQHLAELNRVAEENRRLSAEVARMKSLCEEVFSRILDRADEKHMNLMHLFHQADSDSNGALDQAQFLGIMRGLDIDLSPSELRYVMAELDPDGEGYITARSFSDRMRRAKKQKWTKDDASSPPASPRSSSSAARKSGGGGSPRSSDLRRPPQPPRTGSGGSSSSSEQWFPSRAWVHVVQPPAMTSTGLKMVIEPQKYTTHLEDGMKRLCSNVLTHEQMRDAFSKLDADGSGEVDIDEFRHALRELKVHCNEPQVSAMFRFYDADGGGTVSIDEFISGTWEWKYEQVWKVISDAIKGVGGIDLEKLFRHAAEAYTSTSGGTDPGSPGGRSSAGANLEDLRIQWEPFRKAVRRNLGVKQHELKDRELRGIFDYACHEDAPEVDEPGTGAPSPPTIGWKAFSRLLQAPSSEGKVDVRHETLAGRILCKVAENAEVKKVNCTQLFDSMDDEGLGGLDRKQLQKAMATLDVPTTPDELSAVMAELDPERRGLVRTREFADRMRSTLRHLDRISRGREGSRRGPGSTSPRDSTGVARAGSSESPRAATRSEETEQVTAAPPQQQRKGLLQRAQEGLEEARAASDAALASQSGAEMTEMQASELADALQAAQAEAAEAMRAAVAAQVRLQAVATVFAGADLLAGDFDLSSAQQSQQLLLQSQLQQQPQPQPQPQPQQPRRQRRQITVQKVKRAVAVTSAMKPAAAAAPAEEGLPPPAAAADVSVVGWVDKTAAQRQQEPAAAPRAVRVVRGRSMSDVKRRQDALRQAKESRAGAADR
jgi:Ca2+-binding EF-hand superfamily protein